MDQKDQVKLASDIVDLIGAHVKLTKAGKHFKGLCPFHSEKSPSFIVSPELQIFKCFGCGESGDVFSFLQKYEGMEFVEALNFLADKAGIKLVNQYKQNTQKDILYKINEAAAQFYHFILTTHEAGKGALEYVLKTRGLNQESIDTFLIGYAPENPSALYSYLVNKKKYNIDDIQKAGLVVRLPESGKLMDRFRGRVIFPLLDHRGNYVGLAGRIMPGPKADKLAKYINSPETEIYHKSSILYGYNITRGDIRKVNQAIVVEGELDLISSYQAGITNAVAIKGSALTEEQVKILSRVTSELILALDSDLAGDAAARRGINVAANSGMTIKVISSDKFKDPDEFARGDPQGYKKAIEDALDVWEFIINSSLKRNSPDSGTGKAKISREIIPILATIEDSIVAAHYAGVLAGKIGVPTEAVMSQIESMKSRAKPAVVPIVTTQKEQKIGREELLEKNLVSLLVAIDPTRLLDSEYSAIVRSHFGKKILEGLVTYNQSHEKFVLQEFVDSLPVEISEGLKDLILTNTADINPSDLQKEVELVYEELRKLQIKTQRVRLIELITKYEKEGDVVNLKIAEEALSNLQKK